MIVEVKIPTPGESITEVELARWMVTDGQIVKKDQVLAEVESDKATLSVVAPCAGKIKILITEGNTVAAGIVGCSIDDSFASQEVSVPVVKEEKKAEVASTVASKAIETSKETEHVKISPLAKQLMAENHLSVEDVLAGIQRIGTKEVEQVLEVSKAKAFPSVSAQPTERAVERTKMTQLRKKISQRLVEVKNQTAMLTTFNEVDMSKVMTLRTKYQKEFVDKHQVKLGFMSFFIKAAATALKAYPMVNARIEGEEIVIPNYADISVAVQTPKGLMVPVIRDVASLSLAEIELTLKQLAEKARTSSISIEEMTGGTFTITNGGVFGSMLSTPIINPPQSAILGMHNIVERPVAVDGKVEIRPIMYVALSYDHRIIDGSDSVGFLVKIKQMIERPELLLLGGDSPERLLLEI